MTEENGSGDTRLDRIERALELMILDHEQFRMDLRQLLTAQVLQGDDIKRHSEQLREQSQQIREESRQIADLRAKDAALDARVEALVSGIGKLIDRIPPESLR